MGGDEFCAVVRDEPEAAARIGAIAGAALSDAGEGFDIDSAWGFVVAPGEAETAHEVLRIADRRMYASKAAASLGRPPVGPAARARARGARRGAGRARVARERRCGGGRRAARAHRQPARAAAPRGRAPRRREDGDPRRDPPQAGPARRGRVGLRPAAHADRRMDPLGGAGARRRRQAGPVDARALGRRRATRTACAASRSRSNRGS